jgi:hypothetical protein
MGITAFGGIENAQFSEGGTYVLPGAYRIQILACKYKRTRTGKDAFIVEVEILESNNSERMPGTTMTWMVTTDKEPALGNIKQFICVVAGCSDKEVTEEVVLMIVSQENPFKGKTARISATNITTKAGRPFTKVKWLEDNAEGAAIAAREQEAAAANQGA